MAYRKFNPTVVNQIYASLAQGNYLKTAAGQAGVSYRAVLSWMAKGKSGESKVHVDFYTEVKRIESTWEANTVKELNEFGDAKLKLEMLSRKNPKDWAATSRTVKVVKEKIEEFMEYMIKELAEEPTLLKRFLEAAEKFDLDD